MASPQKLLKLSRNLQIDWKKCIKCQKRTKNPLIKGTKDCFEHFKNAAKVRNDDINAQLVANNEYLASHPVYWHNNCYKSYISKTNLKKFTEMNMVTKLEPATVHGTRSSYPAVEWNLCLFCQKRQHRGDRVLSKIQNATTEKIIKDAAVRRDDHLLISELTSRNLIKIQAKYHASCKSSYTSNSNLDVIKKQIEEDDSLYDSAFQQLLWKIDSDLMLKYRAFDMSKLVSIFRSLLPENNMEGSYRTEKLKRRLISHYGNQIVFQSQELSNKPELVYSSKISIEDAINTTAKLYTRLPNVELDVNTAKETEETDEQFELYVLYHAAKILRRDCKKSLGLDTNFVLPSDINSTKASEVIPESVFMLLKHLLDGDHEQEPLSLTKCEASKETTNRQILSIGQDILYTTSLGKIQTPKHVGLATSIRHLTGSKKVITMLNRCGHTISYDQLERIDTAAALQQATQKTLIPTNICQGPFVQAAADNIDFCEDTIDGKHTTHGTTIVLYQRNSHGIFGETRHEPTTKLRDRSMKLKIEQKALKEYNSSKHHPAPSKLIGQIKWVEWLKTYYPESAYANDLDMAYLLMRLCPTKLWDVNIEEHSNQMVPSWSAFNAIVSSRVPELTTIGYCPLIPESPTNVKTVYTVLKTIQNMLNSLDQDKKVITFDEAIYSKANIITWQRPDEFKDIVLRLGGFHTALTFMAVIGKVYDGSGLKDLLIESEVLGRSTVENVFKGKSYNRCVRGHKLIMEALERLRWAAFCQWKMQSEISIDGQETLIKVLKTCHDAFTKKDAEEICKEHEQLMSSLSGLSKAMENFRITGIEESKTFEFWDHYTNMVKILLRFIRAERDGDWTLHLASMTEMLPYFFAFDRMNYARWGSVYLADMQLLPESAPAVHEEFKKGNFTVSRSKNKFSQLWTDMALEQSVNCDTKSKGGIVGFTKRDGAVDRWFLTAHTRATITRQTKDMCGMDATGKVTTHKEATIKRINRDEKDIISLIKTVCELLKNPFMFWNQTSSGLYNIATGIIMPNDLALRLLGAHTEGVTRMNDFFRDRLNDNVKSVFDPIPKLNIKTFATAWPKSKADKHCLEKMRVNIQDRNLFSRLIVVAKSRDIDLKKLLSHELTAVPLALAYDDGTLRKTCKSKLLNGIENVQLTESINTLPPSQTATAWIIDGMAIIQMLKSAGAKCFGELSDELFAVVCRPLNSDATCTRVDVIFDRYDTINSIKGLERERRQSVSSFEVMIHGRQTPLPQQWGKYISNPSNKSNLARFLSEAWTSKAQTHLKADQQLVLAGGFKAGEECYRITCQGKEPQEKLCSSQEEADTRMLLHAYHASRSHQRIIVWSPDTDVFVLCLHFFESLEIHQLWFHTGVQSKSRYIPVHEIAETIGHLACQMLPAFHALTGCDSTSGLAKIGKVRAWKLFHENIKEYKGLSTFGTSVKPSNEAIATASSFFAKLYCSTDKEGDMDTLRHHLFCRKQAVNEALPPTSDSSGHHINRACYQTYIWKNSLVAMPNLPSPIGNGWNMQDQTMIPILMSKSPAPKALVELVTCGCEKSHCSKNCSCTKQKMACTDACACSGGDDCHNVYKVERVSIVDESDGSESDSDCDI